METKAGIYTSEFWVMMLIQLLIWLRDSSVFSSVGGTWGHVFDTISSALLAGLYAWSRSKAKQGKTVDPNNPNNYKLIPRNPMRDISKKNTVRVS